MITSDCHMHTSFSTDSSATPETMLDTTAWLLSGNSPISAS